jgi:hypothetical protein
LLNNVDRAVKLKGCVPELLQFGVSRWAEMKHHIARKFAEVSDKVDSRLTIGVWPRVLIFQLTDSLTELIQECIYDRISQYFHNPNLFGGYQLEAEISRTNASIRREISAF